MRHLRLRCVYKKNLIIKLKLLALFINVKNCKYSRIDSWSNRSKYPDCNCSVVTYSTPYK